MKKIDVRGYRGLLAVAVFAAAATWATSADAGAPDRLDERLARVLRDAGFTGRVQEALEGRLGRRIDPRLADLGRLGRTLEAAPD